MVNMIKASQQPRTGFENTDRSRAECRSGLPWEEAPFLDFFFPNHGRLPV
jgi:hypothetical protein